MKIANAKSRTLFNIPIDAVTLQQVVEVCDEHIKGGRNLVIAVVNAAKVVNMQRDDQLLASIMKSDIILADGASIVWASRILRRSLPERVAGIDLFLCLLELANAHGYSVYFLGARRNVVQRVATCVRKSYPNVHVAGYRDGYFAIQDGQKIADEIRRTQCNMLFVAMTSPKKEQFLADWGATLDGTVCHGVGGSFDVLVGQVKRAPQFMQRAGLEWLYRVIQEPGRLWWRYLATNTLFARMLVRELWGGERRWMQTASGRRTRTQRESDD